MGQQEKIQKPETSKNEVRRRMREQTAADKGGSSKPRESPGCHTK